MDFLNIAISIILFFGFALLFIWIPERQKGACSFGVQIPSEHLHDRPLKNIRRLYRFGIVLTGILVFIVNILIGQFMNDTTANTLMPLLLALYFGCALWLFYVARRSVASLKKRKGWVSAPQKGVTAMPLDRSFSERRLAPSAWWLCAHAVLIAATALLLYLAYPYMPGYLPTMIDLAGNPAGYFPKTPQLLCIPVLLQMLITLICAGAYHMVKNSKLNLDPADAAGSLKRSRRFRVVWSTYALVLAFVLDLLVYTSAQLLFLTPELRYITPYLMGGVLLALLAVTLWLGYSTSKYAGRKRKK